MRLKVRDRLADEFERPQQRREATLIHLNVVSQLIQDINFAQHSVDGWTS